MSNTNNTKKNVITIVDPFIVWHPMAKAWVVSGDAGKGRTYRPLGSMRLTPAAKNHDASDADLRLLAEKTLAFHHYGFTGSISVRRNEVG